MDSHDNLNWHKLQCMGIDAVDCVSSCGVELFEHTDNSLHFGTPVLHSFPMKRCVFIAALRCRSSCSAFGVVHTLTYASNCMRRRLDRNGSRRWMFHFCCIHIQMMLRTILRNVGVFEWPTFSTFLMFWNVQLNGNGAVLNYQLKTREVRERCQHGHFPLNASLIVSSHTHQTGADAPQSLFKNVLRKRLVQDKPFCNVANEQATSDFINQ